MSAYHAPMSLPERCCGRCRWAWDGKCHAALPSWALAAIPPDPAGHDPAMVTPYYGGDCARFEPAAVPSRATFDG